MEEATEMVGPSDFAKADVGDVELKIDLSIFENDIFSETRFRAGGE